MNQKFDFIIANPPYSIGNQITKTIVDNIDFGQYINLMPASKYKGQQLYKDVQHIEKAEDLFEDAMVGDSLTITSIKPNAGTFADYEQFQNQLRDPRFVEFYILNANYPSTFRYSHCDKKSELPEVVTSFMITMRTIQNGTHSVNGNAADVRYNIQNIADNIPWDITHDCASCNFLRFQSIQEKQNLIQFWYHNPLMNDLIKGLNASSGKITAAIPNIDWSKDRDYEHCILADIMKWLKEDNSVEA